MNYFKHLCLNWKVALHSLNDFAEHFIHGVLPFVKWKHYHSVDEVSTMPDLTFEKLICEKHDKGNYFSIQYLDKSDGVHHIGYSSYSLDVISKYIKEYFINETCNRRLNHYKKNT